MLTRRTLFMSAGALALTLPLTTVVASKIAVTSERDIALQYIVRRVHEEFGAPDAALWSGLLKPGLASQWMAAPSLEKMVEEQINIIFSGGHARWLKSEFGSVLYKGRLNTWLFSNILDRFPLSVHDDPAMLRAFTALVPEHMR